LDYVDQISKAVLLLIRAGAVFRVVFCLVKLMTAEEEAPQYKKRIRNTLVFYILAELAFVVKDLIIAYYG
jgi:hypothetical protein